MKRLKICAGVVGFLLFTSNIEPVHAGGRHGGSNHTGTNTSNSSVINTSSGRRHGGSNHTGTNVSNVSGHKAGYNAQIAIIRARQILIRLQAARLSRNSDQIDASLAEANRFFQSLLQSQPQVLQQQNVRSVQSW
jgi:hypothetical protein